MNPAGRLLLLLLMSVSVWAQNKTGVLPGTIAGDSMAGVDLQQGLLHWWPDPAEGTDEITGRKGVRRGFGPVEENPDVRFGYAAGWVELGPGITNQTFTLSGWMLQPIRQFGPTSHAIISQNSGFHTGWAFRTHGPNFVEFGSNMILSRAAPPNRALSKGWHAFVIRVSPSQTELWLDVELLETRPGEVSQTRSAEPDLLTVGNTSLGNSPWDGDLRDLRLHGRRLSNDEIQSLAVSQKSQRRDLPAGPTPVLWNSVTPMAANPAHYSLRHFTTDNGLLRSSIQCLH